MAVFLLILRVVCLIFLFAVVYAGFVCAITNRMAELEKIDSPYRVPLIYIGTSILVFPLFSFLCAVTYKLLFW